MATHIDPTEPDPTATDRLHPLVYGSIVVLAIWLVGSVWALFSRGTYAGVTVIVVTLFFLVAVGIPVLIWLTWRRNSEPDVQRADATPFREWAANSFETWTGAMKARDASIQILLPIAAVALGMTIFGVVFLLVVPHLNT
ncbi:MAG TPA: hypothetical protein VFP60_09210 [Pseudolabrys sp.]|nr:hypothetical protein [Pseudolabrys sp.]